MKNKKGFTLIELLSVITVLAVVALITIPIVSNTIERAEKKSAGISADNYIRAVGNALAAAEMDSMVEDGVYEISSDGNLCKGTVDEQNCTGTKLEIEFSGSAPISGRVEIREGVVLNYIDIFVNDYYISSGTNGNIIAKGKWNLCKPATASTVTTGNIPEGNYEIGDEYICEVKDGVFYNFFVISTEGDEDDKVVNLIMDSNIDETGVSVKSSDSKLEKHIDWLSETDYLKAGGEDLSNDEGSCQYAQYCVLNSYGPITSVNYLNNATSDWNDWLTLDETYTEVGGIYTDFPLTGHARLPKLREVQSTGCSNSSSNSCPLWMVNYLNGVSQYYSDGVSSGNNGAYWILDAGTSNQDQDSVDYTGLISTYTHDGVNRGVRPVISVLPSNLN